MADIHLAETDTDIMRCGPVLKELRPHIPEDEVLARVRRQERDGYRLAMLEDAAQVKAVAGFRIYETLFSGRMLYIDDLVTRAEARSRGHGAELLRWLVEHAREQGCDNLELDSGHQRHAAHRFYFAQRLAIVSYHFRLALK